MGITKSAVKRLERKASVRFGSELVIITAESRAEANAAIEEALRQGKSPICIARAVAEKYSSS